VYLDMDEAKKILKATTLSSLSALEKLAKDKNPYVRAALLRNKNVSEQVILRLIKDKEIVVRWSVTGNPQAFKKLQKEDSPAYSHKKSDIKSIASLMRKDSSSHSLSKRGKEYSSLIEQKLGVKQKKIKCEIAMICDLYNFILHERKEWEQNPSDSAFSFTKRPIDDFLDSILWSGWHDYDLDTSLRYGCLFYEGPLIPPIFGFSYDPWMWSWEESMYYMGYVDRYGGGTRLWEY